jgi:hypothetical protein
VGHMFATPVGSAFGKGIYTADVFAKSLPYCSGVTQNGGIRCFMLLCEVALGTSQDVGGNYEYSDVPLDLTKQQSRKAHGSTIPDPRHTITRDDGSFLPRFALHYSKT